MNTIFGLIRIKFFMLLIVHNRAQKVQNRRVPGQHPTAEMEEGEIVTFQRKNDPNCTLTSLYFSVRKIHYRSTDFPHPSTRDFYFNFYAVTGETYGENLTELPNADWKRRYVNQIAYIQCTYGWIQDLQVFPHSLNPGGPTENPQKCGIGTVLTELCLIDSGINVQRQGNLARFILSGFPADFPRVERDCPALVGLGMAAYPMGAAHVYFTAAINMRYRLLLIETLDSSSINIFPTQSAKNNYNSDTGTIDPCGECSDICQAWGRRWFFCTGQV